MKVVSWALVLAAVLLLGTSFLGFGCCNNDSPSCDHFQDGGAWDPSGSFIQEIALATLGTEESCVPDGGKPYYQMQLGLNSSAAAETIACIFAALKAITPSWDALDIFGRSAWCSEAVSYWHREAGIPYPGGYRGGPLLNWQLPTTYALQTFYTEEELSGGRGRWLDWSELDYSSFKPGETIPVPGAYVIIRKYNAATRTWEGESHSLMINTLHVNITTSGRVTRVEASLLEGNSRNKVRSDRVFDDLLSLTPAGDQWIGGDHKIVGFGIDLDSYGKPIYDRSRLIVSQSRETRVTKPTWIDVRDPIWELYFRNLAAALARYSKTIRYGIPVRSKTLKVKGIPDGRNKWYLPAHAGTASVEIDLLAEHPLPIEGLVLTWEGRPPRAYQVQWAGQNRQFHTALVPTLDLQKLIHSNLVPLPVMFSAQGVKVRYLRFIFPSQTRGTVLREVRFLYNWGKGEDASQVP